MKNLKKSVPVLPMPNVIVSCRDKEGRNNALAVGATTYVSSDPLLIMISICPDRFSHHIIKESGEFVISIPETDLRKEYGYLGSKSGRDVDKFSVLGLKWEDGTVVNAPLLTDCAINAECKVTGSIMQGNYELFFATVEEIHCKEEYLDKNDNIQWKKIDLI